jgi:hypothetical protein
MPPFFWSLRVGLSQDFNRVRTFVTDGEGLHGIAFVNTVLGAVETAAPLARLVATHCAEIRGTLMPHAYDARVLRLALHGKETAMQCTTHLHPLIGFGILVFLLCTTPLRDALALPVGLVARWSGDIDALNATGPQYDGTLLNGALAGQPGLIAGAFQFDGTAAFVSTPLRLLTLPAQGTIALWVNPADLSGEIYGIFGTFGLTPGNDRLWLNARGEQGGLEVAKNTLVVNIGYCCLNEIVVPSPLLRNTWTHIALTYD